MKKELIMFEGGWCIPCKAFKPIFEETAAEFPDVDFKPLDVIKHKAIADHYGVRSIPYIIYLVNGQRVNEKANPTNRQHILNVLRNL